MADNTDIEWSDATWNPVRGCTKVSAGCDNCYAMSVAHRFSGEGQPYEGLTRKIGGRGQWNGRVRLVPEKLGEPLHWRKPRRVFVNSMSDLFHPDVPFEFIDQVFAVMALAPQHVFQVLTKRPERMRSYLSEDRREAWAKAGIKWMGEDPDPILDGIHLGNRALANLWLGVSVENQDTADERIPPLLETPAAVRWISAEPLLGAVDVQPYLTCPYCHGHSIGDECSCHAQSAEEAFSLDWVVVGGESGPKARPMHPDWARSLRDQCRAAGVPFFFKQWGEWLPGQNEYCPRPHQEIAHHQDGRWGLTKTRLAGRPLTDRNYVTWNREGVMRAGPFPIEAHAWAERVGKKAAGRMLDGRTWDEMPA